MKEQGRMRIGGCPLSDLYQYSNCSQVYPAYTLPLDAMMVEYVPVLEVAPSMVKSLTVFWLLVYSQMRKASIMGIEAPVNS